MILLGLERRSGDRPYSSSLIRMTLSWAYASCVFAFAQFLQSELLCTQVYNNNKTSILRQMSYSLLQGSSE